MNPSPCWSCSIPNSWAVQGEERERRGETVAPCNYPVRGKTSANQNQNLLLPVSKYCLPASAVGCCKSGFNLGEGGGGRGGGMPHGRGGEGCGRGGGTVCLAVCFFRRQKLYFPSSPQPKRRLIRMSGRSLPLPCLLMSF